VGAGHGEVVGGCELEAEGSGIEWVDGSEVDCV
jgi:hypothetical protein